MYSRTWTRTHHTVGSYKLHVQHELVLIQFGHVQDMYSYCTYGTWNRTRTWRTLTLTLMHDSEHVAWVWTCCMDRKLLHRYGHVPWTWTCCTDTDICMDMDMLHGYGYVVLMWTCCMDMGINILLTWTWSWAWTWTRTWTRYGLRYGQEQQ